MPFAVQWGSHPFNESLCEPTKKERQNFPAEGNDGICRSGEERHWSAVEAAIAEMQMYSRVRHITMSFLSLQTCVSVFWKAGMCVCVRKGFYLPERCIFRPLWLLELDQSVPVQQSRECSSCDQTLNDCTVWDISVSQGTNCGGAVTQKLPSRAAAT